MHEPASCQPDCGVRIVRPGQEALHSRCTRLAVKCRMGGPNEDHAFPPERVKAAQELYKKSGGMPARLREEMMLDVLRGAHNEV